MAFDSTTFASDFADLFGAFAQQQKEQNENIVSALEQVGSNVGAKKGVIDKAKDFANEAQEKYLGGRPKTGPRQVKKAAIGVVIEDITKKAASKIKPGAGATEGGDGEAPKTKMGLLSLLGGLLGVGAVGVIGKVFGMGAGAGVAAGLLAKIGPMIFKPLKLVAKRLPIIGSLFSFYEAYKHFEKGGVDNIMLGLLDVGAGFMYMIPGVGTAIGLGLDILSYFINERVEEHKLEGGDTSWLGSMYDKVITYLSETDQIKWMVKLGDLFSVLWGEPGNLDNWSNFFTHLGGLGFGVIDLLKNFDKTVGTALGITDEKGEGKGLVAELISLVTEYVVDPLLEMIEAAFVYVKEAIVAAGKTVLDSAKTAAGFTPPGMVFKGLKAGYDKFIKEDPEETRRKELQKYKDILMKESSELSEDERALRNKRIKEQGYDKFEADQEAMRKGPTTYVPTLGGPKMDDFAVIGGNIVELPKTAIVAGGKVQAFSGDDTVIGFKEGQALLTGITNLIDVGQQQLKVLQEYLLKDDNNIIAPSTNNNSTYNFSVESGVTSFRKMVS